MRKEGRLSEEEAWNDLEQLEHAARVADLPSFESLTSTGDARALEALLKEAGLYTEPTTPDTIELGKDQLELLQLVALEKDPKEIYYQEQAAQIVKAQFRERFGYEVPLFPTERIIAVSRQQMNLLYPQISEHARDGLFDPVKKIIVINQDPSLQLAKRIHIVTHELVHWSLDALRPKPSKYDIFRRRIDEGLTEQIALEISSSIVSQPDLIEGMQQWFSDPNLTSEHLSDKQPSLAYFARTDIRQVDQEVFNYSTRYAYGRERVFLHFLSYFINQFSSDPDRSDILKIFVDLNAGNEKEFKLMIKNTFGEEGLRLIRESVYDPLFDLMDKLAKLRRNMNI